MEYEMMVQDHPQYANALAGSRPYFAKNKKGQVLIHNGRMFVNSILRREEWAIMDSDVMAAAVQPLNIARILIEQGLSRPLTNIGQLVVQYPRRGEMTAADISMRLHASGEKDLIDQDFAGVPVPIIFKEFEIDGRLLASGRLMGQDLDTTNAEAAARVVAEKVEDLILNGDTKINLNGQTIYGLTTHPNRNTDTATNYGGGDWGTIDNVTATIAGMIRAAQADGFYGPYGVFAATDQYNEAALKWFSDGTGTTPAERVRRLGQGAMTQQIRFFEPSAQLPSGTIVLVHLSRDVIELRILNGYWPVRNVEWTTGDGSLNKFKVMTVMTPVAKAASGNKSGIVIATGA